MADHTTPDLDPTANLTDRSPAYAHVRDPHLRATLDTVAELRARVEAMLSDPSTSLDAEGNAISKAEHFRHLRADLALLRGQNRKIAHMLRDSKAETARQKNEVDALHLQMQNVYYEQRHLQSEITACDEYQHPYRDLGMLAEHEFLAEFPEWRERRREPGETQAGKTQAGKTQAGLASHSRVKVEAEDEDEDEDEGIEADAEPVEKDIVGDEMDGSAAVPNEERMLSTPVSLPQSQSQSQSQSQMPQKGDEAMDVDAQTQTQTQESAGKGKARAKLEEEEDRGEAGLMRARIAHEHAVRQSLSDETQALLRRKAALMRENAKRKDDLTKLDDHLERFVETAKPIKDTFDKKHRRKNKRARRP